MKKATVSKQEFLGIIHGISMENWEKNARAYHGVDLYKLDNTDILCQKDECQDFQEAVEAGSHPYGFLSSVHNNLVNMLSDAKFFIPEMERMEYHFMAIYKDGIVKISRNYNPLGAPDLYLDLKTWELVEKPRGESEYYC